MDLFHSFENSPISIAEDVSGYPQLASVQENGGIGFDYRMAMAVPGMIMSSFVTFKDIYTELLSKSKIDHWDIQKLLHTLTNRRYRHPIFIGMFIDSRRNTFAIVNAMISLLLVVRPSPSGLWTSTCI